MTRLSAKIAICFLVFAAIMAGGAYLNNRSLLKGELPFIMNSGPGYAPKASSFSGGNHAIQPRLIYQPFFQPRQYVRILPSNHFSNKKEQDFVQDSSTINSFDK
jgi:hypothetical protein